MLTRHVGGYLVWVEDVSPQLHNVLLTDIAKFYKIQRISSIKKIKINY